MSTARENGLDRRRVTFNAGCSAPIWIALSNSKEYQRPWRQWRIRTSCQQMLVLIRRQTQGGSISTSEWDSRHQERALMPDGLARSGDVACNVCYLETPGGRCAYKTHADER